MSLDPGNEFGFSLSIWALDLVRKHKTKERGNGRIAWQGSYASLLLCYLWRP
jgi:hypothetical protein